MINSNLANKVNKLFKRSFGLIIMAKRLLTVRRKGHKRKGYYKDIKPGPGYKKGYISPTKVRRSKKFKIRDVGAPGRGKKVIRIRRTGALTKYGYRIKLSPAMRRAILDKAVKEYGKDRVWRMLNAQVRLREMGGVAGEVFRPETKITGQAFQADRSYITKKYGGPVPRAAIKAWKAMSPALRSKKMRLAKGLA